MDFKISNLIHNKESEYLEFKSEWYWTKDCGPNDKVWGEFLKDFIALVNCNHKYTDQNKYLIIGVNESETEIEKRICNVDIKSIGYSTVDELKEKIIEKIDSYFRCNSVRENVYTNFDVEYEDAIDRKIILFTIKPVNGIVVLAKDLQDKNRTEKMNNVFIRSLKSPGDPEVINASPEDISDLRYSLGQNKENRELNKEKSVEKTMRLFVDNNSMYSLSDEVHKEKMKKEGVLFEVYHVTSDVNNINYIYLFDKSNQIKTYEYLFANNILMKNADNIVLIDNGLKKDVNGIKEKFKAKGVYSLDGFALKYLYKKHLDEDIYHDGKFRRQRQIKNFVDPLSEDSNEKNALTKLSEWYEKESMPLMVVKGYGGVGKTTLVKYFLDDLYRRYVNDSSRTKILFIDSKKIIDEMSREGNIDNIFFFYQAYAKSQNISHQFDKGLLELSLDNGNLLLVLDGIDEVIAKLGSKFKVNSFIENIYNNYLLGNGRTKIIFTCRDFFWDISKVERSISTLEIKPFTKVLAKKLFLKQFDEGSKEIKQCVAYSDNFKMTEGQNKENVYIPYILDVIMDMVQQQKGLGEVSKEDVISNVLNTDITNDYFVGRICNREQKKLNNLDVDNQLEFFMSMAVNFNGTAHFDNRSKLFRNLESSESEEIFNLFKAHTLVSCEKDSQFITFKYDFFKDYFINLYVSKYFINKENFLSDSGFIDIVNEHVGLGKSFTYYLCQRVSYDESLKFFVIEIIESVVEVLKEQENILYRKLISSLLSILLVGLEKSDQQYNVENITELIEDIFGSEFEYLSIINYLESKGKNTIFDFKNRNIKNSWFENYSRFWECKINSDTRFYKGSFNHLEPRDDVSLPLIHKGLFVDCDTSGIREILDRDNKNKKSKEKLIKDDVLDIFGLFEVTGGYKEQKVEYINHKSNSQVLKKLLKNKVILPYKNPKKPRMKQYRIADEYHDVISLSDQSGDDGINFALLTILKFFK